MSRNPMDITINTTTSMDSMVVVYFFDNNSEELLREYEIDAGLVPSVGEIVHLIDVEMKAETLDDIEQGNEDRRVSDSDSFVVRERVFSYGDTKIETTEEDNNSEITVMSVDVYVEPYSESKGE